MTGVDKLVLAAGLSFSLIFPSNTDIDLTSYYRVLTEEQYKTEYPMEYEYNKQWQQELEATERAQHANDGLFERLERERKEKEEKEKTMKDIDIVDIRKAVKDKKIVFYVKKEKYGDKYKIYLRWYNDNGEIMEVGEVEGLDIKEKEEEGVP